MSNFTDPIPSDGRLVRAVRRAAEHVSHAKLLTKIARETGGNVEAERQRARDRRFEFQDPVDLRGIPALGRGVGGTIRGTRPDAIADRDPDE
jgi:hypothetical protein